MPSDDSRGFSGNGIDNIDGECPDKTYHGN